MSEMLSESQLQEEKFENLIYALSEVFDQDLQSEHQSIAYYEIYSISHHISKKLETGFKKWYLLFFKTTKSKKLGKNMGIFIYKTF